MSGFCIDIFVGLGISAIILSPWFSFKFYILVFLVLVNFQTFCSLKTLSNKLFKRIISVLSKGAFWQVLQKTAPIFFANLNASSGMSFHASIVWRVFGSIFGSPLQFLEWHPKLRWKVRDVKYSLHCRQISGAKRSFLKKTCFFLGSAAGCPFASLTRKTHPSISELGHWCGGFRSSSCS